MGYSNTNKIIARFPSYVSPISGESVVLVARPSKLNYLFSFLFGGALALLGLVGVGATLSNANDPGIGMGIPSLVILIIGIFVLLRATISILSSQYTVSNKRIISKRGLISVRISEVWINDIRGVNFSRSLWQALIGTGNIVIGTAATGGAEIVITGVAGAKRMVDKINSLRSL